MSFFEKLKIEKEENSSEEDTEEKEAPEETIAEAEKEKEAPEEAEAEPAIEKKPKKKIKVKKKSGKEETGQKAKTKKARWFESEGQLTVDVYQTGEDLIIQSAVAGVSTEDLDISVEKDMVIIRGRREKPEDGQARNYFYQECYWGPFSREIILPVEVDALRSEASLKDGILTIRLPKIERDKKKKITVRPD